MSERKAPRFQGKLTSWNDEKGFGFISPNGGGPAVFAHITSFSSRAIRPAENDILTYALTSNARGQPRAERIALVRQRPPRAGSPPAGAGSTIIAIAFLGLVGALVLIGKLPGALFGFYGGLSALSFIVYWRDKSAARNHQRRTSENTLHMLGLAGGWPGGLLAQHLLRHKSKKASFRAGFWLTVSLNCAALVWLLLPSGSATLRALSGQG